MSIYNEIRREVRLSAGSISEGSWIAHVLSDRGLTRKRAPNRRDVNSRAKPCPPSKRAAIEAAVDKLFPSPDLNSSDGTEVAKDL
jgi:hypothetical protein